MENTTKPKNKNIIKELIPYIIIILVIIIVKKYLFTTVLVHGDSMNNTLKDNDVMILDKLDYKTGNINRFDIIVADVENTRLIKRVIGLPGEHVKYENNELYINDKKIEDNYGTGITYDFDINSLNIDTIPKDHYFVLGDNRENSVDSRIIGVISKEDILGHATYVIFPFNRFGITVE